jgi:hypothetical protein
MGTLFAQEWNIGIGFQEPLLNQLLRLDVELEHDVVLLDFINRFGPAPL